MTFDAMDSFVMACQKLDELRFAGTTDWGILGKNILRNKQLKASTRLLLFWLCSIIDQFYGYVNIWTNGERAMLKLIVDDPHSFSDVKQKIENLSRDRKGNILGDIFSHGKKFALVRDDYKRIRNTFEFLTQYARPETSLDVKFVKAIGELIAGCYGTNGIPRIAYFLDGWMFSDITVSVKPSLTELRRFRNKPRKRLWMFIMFLRRDPSVLNLFKEALIEVHGKDNGNTLFDIWQGPSKFDPKEIELPGDMWNQRLFKALLSELPAFLKQNPKQTARKLASRFNLSPSIFDVTFELGANKCKFLDCSPCPFGDNEICHKGKYRFCSVTDWLFPYYRRKDTGRICDPEVCPIGKDLGKSLCTREIDREITH